MGNNINQEDILIKCLTIPQGSYDDTNASIMIKVEVKTTQQENLWNNGNPKEIPMSKDQKGMGGDNYTNDRLNKAAKEDDGYTDGESSKQAEAALEAQKQAKKNGAEVKTEKLDIYVDNDGNLLGDPVPRKW
jgi:hypothetical protein